MNTAMTLDIPADARSVLDFWKEAGPDKWFAKDDAFDDLFRSRFLALHEKAARGELHHWLDAPDSALALLILLDQFPRNCFRNTIRMYATDPLAREMAAEAIARGHDRLIPQEMAHFMYLPYGHSETLADQARCVALSERLGEPNLGHARHHHDLVKRFGRFPHRNPILGRTMTAEEQRYLDEGGYKG